MKILIIGDKGQLGYELKRSQPRDVEITTCDLPEVNITDAEQVNRIVQEVRPDVVINSAAYTAVDRAEDERDLAFTVNATAIGHIIEAVRPLGSRLIHISTDFIFDGRKGSPYLPEDAPKPLGVYGASKAAGEQLLLSEYPEKSFIVRTAWLYSEHGQNFVKTMLNLFKDRESLNVIADQVGTPTWAYHLACFLWRLVESPETPPGVYHFTDAGVASWYDFAVAIEEESRKWRGKTVDIRPIRTDEYPTKAVRPPYSVLEKRFPETLSGFTYVHWREALRRMLGRLLVE